MTDQDQKLKHDSDDSIEQVDTSIEPELLGAELSEELKNSGTGFVEEVAIAKALEPEPVKIVPKLSEKDFDLEIKSSDLVKPVPQKDFSMPEQSKQVDEIVETYIVKPTIANSVR